MTVFAIGIHPDGGHFVIYTFNTVTGSYDPVLQLTNVPFQSTGDRIGIPYFWEKVFFQSPSAMSDHEFLEFRIGGTFPNQEGRGVGGFLYRSDSDRLTLWTENQRGQAFATPSQSERDLGVGSHDNNLLQRGWLLALAANTKMCRSPSLTRISSLMPVPWKA